MNTYAFAVPLKAGSSARLEDFATEVLGPRSAEHEEQMRRYRLTKQYGWVQQTPMGEMFIAYFAAEGDFLEVNRRFAASSHPFDVWYKQQLGEILGQDFDQPLADGLVEVLWQGCAGSSQGAERPFASVVPVREGQTEALRRAAAELDGPRAGEVQEYFRRYSANGESWYLQHTPQGDFLIDYAEAEDPMQAFHQFARSEEPLDVWLKQLIADTTGVDYAQWSGDMPRLVLHAEKPVMAAAGR